jgi:hypothetical protein
MSDMPTSTRARLYRIQRHMGTVPLATHAQALAIGQRQLASGPRLSSGAIPPVETVVWLIER